MLRSLLRGYAAPAERCDRAPNACCENQHTNRTPHSETPSLRGFEVAISVWKPNITPWPLHINLSVTEGISWMDRDHAAVLFYDGSGCCRELQ